MALLKFFISKKEITSDIAKERLQIIVSEQRKNSKEPNYLPMLKKDLIKVIKKYINLNSETLCVKLDHKNKKNIKIFELNIVFPEKNFLNKK
ncbi:minE [Wigglesworthia glossinidia endosymbiont of Glossina brevipalpis]|uniref:Cell division topological specificity factor n=1 Tax=Wigglesworthia glossinidia brevipalpis TaxID=36870 RepID=MINE_WIGBR|nr:RecName: Full=Cell division topological specificity factor [Wigglesworthia glossinidia endosymbiont of Glossina brevipalpis]BAC24519.1 minE [Wigglesworthia glossinidia endosymbiont of Glossina brevipalpis]